MEQAATVEPPRRIMTVPCPRCGYDLSGVVSSWTDSCPLEGVCSECGAGVTWSNLLSRGVFRGDPRVSHWSFEHAESGLVAAYLRTSLRALTPLTLFGGLSRFDPIRPRRLLALVGVAMVILAVVATTLAVARRFGSASVATQSSSPSSTAQWSAANAWREVGEDVGGVAVCCAVVMVFPLTNSMVFALLGFGRARAPVQLSHVWRVNVYALVGLMNGVTIVLIAGTCAVFLVGPPSILDAAGSLLGALLALAAGVWFLIWIVAWLPMAIDEYFLGEPSVLNWAWFVVLPGLGLVVVVIAKAVSGHY